MNISELYINGRKVEVSSDGQIWTDDNMGIHIEGECIFIYGKVDFTDGQQSEPQPKQIESYVNKPCYTGCRVRLSHFGIKMQEPHNLIGTVIGYIPYPINPHTDGIVTVKWDNRTEPESMHIDHVQVAPKEAYQCTPKS